MSPERRRLASALLLSLLIHTLLLSLTFDGQGYWLRGFGFPWRERRIEATDLSVTFVPAQITAAEPVGTSVRGSMQASIGQSVARGSAPTPSVSPAPTLGRKAEAIVPKAKRAPRAKPTAKAGPQPDAATGASSANAPLRTEESGDAATTPIADQVVIAVEQSDEATLVVPAAPSGPASVIASAPSASTPETAMPSPRDTGDSTPVRIDQEEPDRAVEPAKLDPSKQEAQTQAEQQAAAQEAARQEAARAENARIEAERHEAARVEATRVDAARAARVEVARVEAARVDAARAARVEVARVEAARVGAARAEAARVEAARVGAARVEAARAEAARVEAARVEAARAEAAHVEAARVEAARVEAARVEAARVEAASVEAARVEATRGEAARVEAARVEAARVEAARVEAARVEAARVEAARVEAARVEAARVEAARVETARVETSRVEAARVEAARVEAARVDAARAEAARAEAAREERLRAIGRQLDEEAAQRDAESARQSPSQAPWSRSARRYRLFGRTDPNAEIILYAEAWARKIHLNTTIDMVREVAKQPHTDPVVTVAIRTDGSVESVTFVLSSGVPAIDEAIRRIVDSQKPYQTFPPGLAREYDVIEIRRTWHFDTAIRLY